ncbi:hypothetical protein [Marinicella meishanensis]|uniref:hypothetical protein n=1 Tax=Marinicella meishanensis TaxID=2873263 RepID=UPI001CBBBAC1|nr:hypothetical protein [Marinicella sp. NBU2979]
MQLTIQYAVRDYLAAARYKFKRVTADIKRRGQCVAFVVMRLIQPFVLLVLGVRAWRGRLRPTYFFEFTEQGVDIATASSQKFMSRERFVAYHLTTPQFMLLEFNVADDPDPHHLLFPSRVMSGDIWQQLNALFVAQQLPQLT